MKTRRGPVARPSAVPVFGRVVMNVIEMSLEVILVFEGMFPVPRLPDARLLSRLRASLMCSTAPPRELFFCKFLSDPVQRLQPYHNPCELGIPERLGDRQTGVRPWYSNLHRSTFVAIVSAGGRAPA
jgi:hypothetical protein